MTQLTLPPSIANQRWVPHSSPVFGLEWDTQHSTPQSRSCVLRSEGEGPAVLSTSSRSTGAPHPGFPVKFVGADELHAAFPNESRARGRCLVPRTGKSGHLARFSRDVGYHCFPPCHPDRSEPGFPATRHWTWPRVRLSAKKAAMKFANAPSLDRKSGGAQWRDLRSLFRLSSPPACPSLPWGMPWEQSKEITLQNSPRMRGPEGRLAKHQPSPEPGFPATQRWTRPRVRLSVRKGA
jgi:hypothetical protein